MWTLMNYMWGQQGVWGIYISRNIVSLDSKGSEMGCNEGRMANQIGQVQRPAGLPGLWWIQRAQCWGLRLISTLSPNSRAIFVVSEDGATAIGGVAIPVGLQKKASIKNGYFQALKSKGIFHIRFYTSRRVCNPFHLYSIHLEWEVWLMPVLLSYSGST